jgi:hypothetical protein
MKKKIIFLSVFLICAYTLAYAAGEKFIATLTGQEEVPPVTTSASGTATFTVPADGKSVHYIIKVKDLTDPTAAHVHAGEPGQEGPPVAMLLTKEKSGKHTGVLVRGILREKDLVGNYKGNIGGFITDMKSGKLYVNVHTKANPNGELRGQIKPEMK